MSARATSSRGVSPPAGAARTRGVPAWAQGACVAARRAIHTQRARWPVICPQVRPAGPVRVGFVGDGPYGDVNAGYGFDAASPDLGPGTNGGHWTLQVAPKALLAFSVSRAGRPASQTTTIAGRPVTIYRIRGYDQGGGYYADHVVVEWVGRKAGCQTSVHGYAHRQLAVRMMRAIIQQCAKGLG